MSPNPSPLTWFQQFGVDEATLKVVLAEATALGADDAELYFEHTLSTAVGLSDGVVNRAHTSVDLGMGVRVVVGDQVGYAYTEDLSTEQLLRAASTARAIAHTGRGPTSVEIDLKGQRPDF
ncbi:MAG: DNA gyrase modulator, partial [Myxococcota bacterium]